MTGLSDKAKQYLDLHLTEEDKKELMLLTISQNTNAKVILSEKVRKVMDKAIDIQAIQEQSKKENPDKKNK